MLTETEIRSAKPREKPFKLFDERGLFILVNPDGSRWWRFKYQFETREKLLSLGIYPDVPLRRAREKRDDARRLVADGVDPSARRKAPAEARCTSITYRNQRHRRPFEFPLVNRCGRSH